MRCAVYSLEQITSSRFGQVDKFTGTLKLDRNIHAAVRTLTVIPALVANAINISRLNLSIPLESQLSVEFWFGCSTI